MRVRVDFKGYWLSSEIQSMVITLDITKSEWQLMQEHEKYLMVRDYLYNTLGDLFYIDAIKEL